MILCRVKVSLWIRGTLHPAGALLSVDAAAFKANENALEPVAATTVSGSGATYQHRMMTAEGGGHVHTH